MFFIPGPVLFCTAAFLPVWVLKVEDLLAYFFYWLGISIGMHAFPSTGDLSNLWAMAPERAKRGNVFGDRERPIDRIAVHP